MSFCPDFFIVGAPKCGTTALYTYLQAQPSVFLAPKELYFFGQDFTFRQARMEADYYASLYREAKSEQLSGDASVWYLYSQTAAKEIHSVNPKAKIIIMLRSPKDLLYSLHSQQLYAGNENIQDFEAALAAEEERKAGKNIPPNIGCPYEGLHYSQVPLFSEQIKRYQTVFPPEQMKIIVYDDFKANTAKVFQEVVSFLGIRADKAIDFARVNPNKRIRFAWLRDVLKQRSPLLIKMAKVLLPSKKLRSFVLDKLWSVNTTYEERRPMRKETRERLNEQFKEEVSELSALLERDLMHWIEERTM